MRAGTIFTIAALAALLLATPAHATPRFTVGQGQNAGVAVDAAGTAYIGWKVNATRASSPPRQRTVGVPSARR